MFRPTLLVLLDADPLTDIASSCTIAGVMLRGQRFGRAEIASMLQALAGGGHNEATKRRSP